MGNGVLGRIHSKESFGAVDGPGIRFVVFTQGCPFRCKYCHNPDTWAYDDGMEIDSADLADEILTYRNFIKNGGVTVSGGEPLLQPDFVADLLKRCKENGFHTAIDTSGGLAVEHCKQALEQADMLLLDIKEIDKDDAIKLTGFSNEKSIALLNYWETTGKDLWIRHVVVPQYTLNYDKLERLAKFLSNYKCVKKVELLPFHKMGEYKWKELNLKYELSEIEPPTNEEMEKIKEIFRKYNLNV